MDYSDTHKRRFSLSEYLALEETSAVRHEFVGGEVYAMTGATFRHARIALNIAAHLRGAARSRGCAVALSDVKVKVADDRVYYPDVIVACGKAADADLVVEAPTLVVEVSSRNSRAVDRREKMDAYLRTPSLQLYMIVDQRRPHVIAYSRANAIDWRRDEFAGSGNVPIECMNTTLSLDEIYEDITLPPLSVSEEWDADDWLDEDE